MAHCIDIRIYYEDTDLAGIVYYANYLKFIERARTEFVRSLGVDQAAMKADAGVVFAVRRVEADYLQPARFDDEITVETSLVESTAARIILDQMIRRDAVELFRATVTLVALKDSGRPARIPAELCQLMKDA